MKRFLLVFIAITTASMNALWAQTCSGNADAVTSETNVTSSSEALGAADDTGAQLFEIGDQLVLDLTDYLNAGASYVIRWRKNSGMTNPSVLVEESSNGSTFTANGSAITISSTSFGNQNMTAGVSTRYVRFTTQNGGNLEVDAITFTNAACTLPSGPGNPSCVNTSEIGGIVYIDANGSASQDNAEEGIAGITVKAYDADDAPGSPSASTTSGSDGTYLLTGMVAATSYRLEFSWSDAYLESGIAGGTTVQFVTSGVCNNNLSLIYPATFCQDAPDLMVPCYVNGDPLAGGTAGTMDVLVKVPYTASNTTPSPTHMLSGVELGTAWGSALQRESEQLFLSSFLKRHCGLGTQGLGGIYKVDLTGGGSVLSNYIDLEDLGVDLGASQLATRDLSASATSSSYDTSAFRLVGKIGMGGLDISDDGTMLWTINLYTKELLSIHIGNPAKASALFTAGDISAYTLPNPGCANGQARPWAVEMHKGVVYVGMVCSGENGGTAADMDAYIYSFDPLTGTFSPTPVLTFPLDYTKGDVHTSSTPVYNNWETWANSWADLHEAGVVGSSTRIMRPQPVLSDIQFDRDDHMILGFFDRNGHLTGRENRNTTPGSTSLFNGYIGGDILLAANNGSGVFTLESNGTAGSMTGCGVGNGQGPGTTSGEYFCGESYASTHEETFQGGLVYFAGEHVFLASLMDPLSVWTGGFGWFDVSTGNTAKRYQIYDTSTNNGTFGKSNGLGLPEAFCDPAPLEIGNRIWVDTDSDGIQDPGEIGIDGVTVKLFQGGIQIDSTTTAGGGAYGFSNLASGTASGFAYNVSALYHNSAYEIRIENAEGGSQQGSLAGKVLTTADNGGGDAQTDLRDSDGSLSGTTATVSFTTGNSGENNHRYDFGFKTPPPCTEPALSGATLAAGTCTGPSPNSDASVTLTGITNGDKADKVAGAIYSGGPVYGAGTNVDVSGGSATLTDLTHNTQYTFRIWNGADDCYKDTTLTTTIISCSTTGSEIYTGCAGDGYSVTVNGTIYIESNPTGTETLTSFNGGDSVVTVNLVFNPNATGSETYTGCAGDGYSLTVNGTTYDENNPSGTESLNAFNGCDSVVTVSLVFNPSPTGSETYTGCAGDGYSVEVNGTTYDENNPSGTESLNAFNGCDSVVTINLVFLTNCLSIGDLVFADLDNDGLFNNNDFGMEDVEAVLYFSDDAIKGDADDVALDSMLTNGFGEYLFDGLTEGYYFIKLNGTGIPSGMVSSTGDGIYDNDGTGAYENLAAVQDSLDNEDDGSQMGGPAPSGMVMSPLYHLTANGETNDGDGDPNHNPSVDFGLYLPQVFDLALIKNLSGGQPGVLMPGDTVSFAITVFNQGTVDAYSILVRDSLPTGLNFDVALNPQWLFNGDGSVTTGIPGPVAAGSSTTVTLIAIVDAGTADGSIFKNIAEIIGADDDTDDGNSPPTDSDSTPDEYVSNDPEGGDDVTDNSNGDEDDQDGATIQINPTQTLSIGDLVFADLDNDGLFNNNDFGMEDVEAVLYFSDDAIKGDADDVALDSMLTNGFGEYLFDGLTEGYYFIKLNGTGIPSGMVSSTGDGIYDNDGTGAYENLAAVQDSLDNEDDGSQMGGMVMSPLYHLTLNGETGDGDADPNHNPSADFGLYQPDTFDLALIKQLLPMQASTVVPGDTVSFTITIYNQGTVDAYSIAVRDSLPTGLNFDVALNPTWFLNGDGSLTTGVAGPLAASGNTSFTLYAIVDAAATDGDMLENSAEIIAADDDADSGNTPPTDSDSTPDEDMSNDPETDDVIDNSSGDEDDADGEEIEVNVGIACDHALAADITDPACHAYTNGSIDLTVTGGEAPFTYDWSNDGAETPDNDTEDLIGVAAGNYSVTVTDNNGCVETADFTVNEPATLGMTGIVNDVTLTMGSDGSIDLTVTGGTLPYTYDWSNDGAETPDNDPEDLSGLMSGTYTVTVTDANGCSEIATFMVNEPGCDHALAADVTDPACHAYTNGSIDLTVTGGEAPFTYDWSSDGAETPDNDTEDLIGVAAGNYSVTVTDNNGCVETADFTVNEPAILGMTGIVNDVTLTMGSDGSIDLTVTGGTLPYTYDWSNDGAETPDNDPEDLSGLMSGTYTVTVTDANGCSEIATFMVNEPGCDHALAADVTDPACHAYTNGSIDLTVTGGEAPFTYDWSNDGAETPDNDTEDLIGVAAGNYSVTVTDNNGCVETADFTVNEPAILGMTGIVNDVTLTMGSDGSIDLTVTGGTLPYTYDWSNDGAETPDNDPEDLSGLMSGTYTVTVTDANGCPEIASFTVNEPAPTLSVGDLVFADLDNDGLFSNPDYGMEDVEVVLYHSDDNVKGNGDDLPIDSMLTNGFGGYLFDGLTAGFYYLKLNGTGIPAGMVSSTGDGIYDNDGAGAYENLAAVQDSLDNEDDGSQMGIMIMSPLYELTLNGETNDGDGDPNHNPSVDFGLYLPQPLVGEFDLALTKVLAPGQQQFFSTNDTINFFVTVYNQGNQDAYNVVLGDYLPTGLSLNDAGWVNAGPGLAQTTVPFLAAGSSIQVPLTLKVTSVFTQFKELVNYAEISAADNDNDPGNTPPTDLDSEPDTDNNNDNGGVPNSPTDDLITDDGSIDEDDHDPSSLIIVTPVDPDGYIYCDKTGKLITGGTITVTPPLGGAVTITMDGSSGRYQFFTNGVPGVYTIGYSHPNGYPLSTNCPAQSDTLDLAALPDPYTVGTTTLDSTGMFLDSADCALNPWYQDINFGLGDSLVFGNNIAVQCVFIGAIVCNDIDHDDLGEPSDPGFASITVNLYDCADTTTILLTTLTDANGDYMFDGLAAGNYRVQFIVPGGYRTVAGDTLSPDGFAPCVTLLFGECDTSTSVCLFACPIVEAGADVSHCSPVESTQLGATVPWGTGSFSWTPIAGLDDPDISNPNASPAATTEYFVTCNDSLGCASTDSLMLLVGTSTPYLSFTPSFTDTLIECDAPVPFDAPIFADDCDPTLDITLDSVTVFNACGYTLTRTWTATNDEGNSAAFVQTVTITDTTPPVLVASHPIFGALSHGDTLYAQCDQIASFNMMVVNAADNCSLVTVDFDEVVTPGDCDMDGYIQLMNCGWTAVDTCGNLDSLFFTVFIIDNIPPTLNGVPADTTFSCESVPAPAAVTASDICDASVIPVLTADTTGTCPLIITLTWTATDDCGNVTVDSQVIAVQDTLPPTFNPACQAVFNFTTSAGATCPASAGISLSVGDEFSQNDTWAVAGQTVPNLAGCLFDNCSDTDSLIVRVASITVTGDACTRTFTVLLDIVDLCGNVSDNSFVCVANVTDDTAPILLGVPADTVVNCGSVPAPAAVTASDLCDASVIPVLTADTTGTCPLIITRTWTATDDCGNVTVDSQVIAVQDTLPPTFNPACQAVFNFTTSAGATCPASAGISLSVGDEFSQNDTWAVAGQTVPNLAGCLFDNCSDTDSLIVRVASITVTGDACTRTFTVLLDIVDLCGNVSDNSFVCVANVTDDTAPTLSGVPANTTADCGSVPAPAAVTASDLCDASVIPVLTADTTGTCPFVITRTWTAADDCGNVSVETQIITVTDNVDPVLSAAPANVTVDCGSVPAPATLTATDNCDASVIPVLTADTSSTCPVIITRTWTATDDCGNTDTEVQIITVNDLGAPVITPTHPALAGLMSGDTLFVQCQQVPGVTSGSATVSDACCPSPTLVWSESVVAGNCLNGGFLQVMQCGWTATDCCGNTSTFFFYVAVSDNTAPNLFNVPAGFTMACDAPVSPAPTVSASDNCDNNVPVILTLDTVTVNACTYQIIRTWTATDDCGNARTATQTITITDGTSPVLFNIPASTTAQCLDELPAVPANIIASDNCDAAPTITLSQTQAPGSGCIIIVTRTWTATDDCGNANSASQTIVVNDTQNPVLVGVPANSSAVCGSIPAPSVVTATDNCDDNVTVTMAQTQSGSGCNQTVTRTWTATDDCGNSVSAEQIIILTDSEAPVITVTHPALAGAMSGDTLTFDCNDAPVLNTNDAFATDNCDLNVPVVRTEFIVAVRPTCEPEGFLVLMRCGWIATDDCGNTTDFFVYLRITDLDPPVIANMPPNVTIECDDVVPAALAPTVSDVCDAAPTLALSVANVSQACGYDIVRTWTATDACGNFSTTVQTVAVRDFTPPVLSPAPANVTVQCNAIPVAATLTATDICDTTSTVTMTQTQSGTGCTYSLIRTWTATDDCGNTAARTQTITVTDTQAPVFVSPPANITASCNNIPAPLPVTASDNCDASVTVTMVQTQSGTGCNLSITRTWTATDDCGNTATHVQIIMLTDNLDPEFNAPLPANVTVDCSNIPNAATLTASDNCDASVTVTFDENENGTGCPYQIIRTWTATDDCGNSVVFTQTITVTDNQPPVLVNPIDITVDCGNAPEPADPAWSDNCDDDLDFDYVEVVENQPCGRVLKRVWTATDNCGNTATVDQLITEIDTQAPTLQFTHPLLASLTDGDTLVMDCANAVVFGADDAIGIDDCGNASVIFVENGITPGDCATDGFIAIMHCTWIAEDNCSNQAPVTLHIVITDELPPVFNFDPADLTVMCGQNIPPFASPTATDACTNVTTVVSNATVITASGYDFIRTWTATDACGNSASVSQTIHVMDLVGPVLQAVPQDSTIYLAQGETTPDPPVIIAIDGCTGFSVPVVFNEVKTPDSNGCDTIIVRTWTATDQFGNTVSESQTITVIGTLDVQIVSASPEICNNSNGTAVLSPASYTYQWSDGGSGATRDNLSNGTYSITATNGTCSDTLTLTIGDICPCVPAVLMSVGITDATCGIANGSVTLNLEGDAADYSYLWLPNVGTVVAPGNARTNLPSGRYVVLVTYQGQFDCVEKFDFDVLDNCPKCAPVFAAEEVTVTLPAGQLKACIPVPYIASQTYQMELDGNPYTGSIEPCDLQTVVFYTYALVPGLGQAGPYQATWNHNGAQLSTIVNDMDELAAAMNAVDPAGNWMNDPVAYGFFSANTSGAYGTLKVTHIASQISAFLQTNTSTKAMGTRLTLPAGEHVLIYTNGAGDCSDTLALTVQTLIPLPGEIFGLRTVTSAYNCAEEDPGFCLDIPFSEIGDYEFFVNGQPYGGEFGTCDYVSAHFYNFIALPGAGNDGPYKVENWTVNGQVHTAEFSAMSDLISLMNQWDPDGNWTLVPAAFALHGGSSAGEYGNLVVKQISTGASAVLTLNTNTTPGAFMPLKPGVLEVTALRFEDGFTDTLTTIFACLTTDQINTVVDLNSVDTLCFNLSELPGKVASVINFCDEGVGAAAEMTVIPGTSCISCKADFVGESEACFIVCDEYGICDTTYIHVTVKEKATEEPSEPQEPTEPHQPAGQDEELEIFNAFSPNGDGMNDVFVIKGLAKYPKHKLSVFNSWGVKVFTTRDYRSDWGGSWGSNNLRNGTYFYVLENGEGKTFTGYVQIRR